MPRVEIQSDGLVEWGKTFYYLVAWLPCAMVALFVKYRIMDTKWFLSIARNIGQIQTELSLIDKISFFRYDLVLGFVIIPIGLIVILRISPSVFRGVIIATVAILFNIFLYAEIISLGNVGHFISYGLLVEAVYFGFERIDLITSYLNLSGILKLLAVFMTIICFSYWAHKRAGRRFSIDHLKNYMKLLFSVMFVIPMLMIIFSLGSNMKETTFHRSIYRQTLYAFLSLKEGKIGDFPNLDAASVRERFRAITESPSVEKNYQYFGKARDNDVLFFIFETGPYRSLNLEGSLEEFPTLRRLMKNSLVSYRHYTTYPYTMHAVFSIMSGMYPLGAINVKISDLDDIYPDMKFPGIMRSLANNGYRTAVYNSYKDRFSQNDEMYLLLGAMKNYIANEFKNENAAKHEGYYNETHFLDALTLEELLRDITQWSTDGQKYIAAFLPEIGHAPWIDVNGNGDDIVARGRALMSLQDRWLGEIVALLEKVGRLDRTIIVVTADHGIRTREEDPGFSGGTIDDYSFHVPMIIYAPSAFMKEMKITYVSSHIDIVPTVLDLLGIENGRLYEEGCSLWDERIKNRKTFFFAGEYLGADGFYKDGKYRMHNIMSGAVYQNNDMNFDENSMLINHPEESENIVDTIHEVESIHRQWIKHAINEKPSLD